MLVQRLYYKLHQILINDDLLEVEFTGKSFSEIIAREYYYHRSYYKKKANYLRAQSSNNNLEMQIRNGCFNELNDFVEKHIINNAQFLRMSQISNYYQQVQRDKNHKEHRSSSYIKTWWKHIYVLPKKQRSPEIVYCNQSERSKEEEFLLIDSDEQINVVANLIKSKVREIKNPYSFVRRKCLLTTLPTLLKNSWICLYISSSIASSSFSKPPSPFLLTSKI